MKEIIIFLFCVLLILNVYTQKPKVAWVSTTATEPWIVLKSIV